VWQMPQATPCTVGSSWIWVGNRVRKEGKGAVVGDNNVVVKN